LSGSSRGKRVAAIDIGSNTLLLTIVEKTDTSLSVLLERSRITRIGEGVEVTGTLSESAQERTLDCLADYRSDLDAWRPDVVLVVGTSALRDAVGSELFLKNAQAVLGVEVEIISGKREAELTYRGALHGLQVHGAVFVFDIGGGSTELIVGDANREKPSFSTSLDIGTVRLSERHRIADPPTHKELTLIETTIRSALRPLLAKIPKRVTTIAVAGTATTLWAVHNSRSGESQGAHGGALNREVLEEQKSLLNKLTTKERLELPGIDEGRADVIGTGAILCHLLLEASGQQRLIVSDRGVRYGLILEALDSCTP